MDSVELLSRFADPETIKNLTIMQRLTAGLITTILGMGITFVALVVLQFVIGLMAKLSAPRIREEATVEKVDELTEKVVGKAPGENDEELVAAITVALAQQLRTSVSSIVIRNIEKVGQPSSSWHKAGIAEQMNNIL